MTYTLAPSLLGSSNSVVRDADGAHIPFDPKNADYVAYLAWVAAGNTPNPAPTPTAAQAAAAQFAAAVAAGLTVTWSVSTALNGAYGLDDTTRNNMTAETVCLMLNNAFTNGGQSKNWPDLGYTFHSFNAVQFKAFATAAAAYYDALVSACQTAAAGQSATWPTASVSIAG